MKILIMAVIRTKPFFIVGILNKRKKILEKLQDLGCTQIEEIENSKKKNTKNTNETLKEIEKIIVDGEKTLKVLKKFENKKKIFNSNKKQKSYEELELCQKNIEQIYKNVKDVIYIEEEIFKSKSKIKQIEKKIDYLKDYQNFTIPIKKIETKNTEILIGKLPKNKIKKDIYENFKDIEKYIYIKAYDDSDLNIKLFIISTKCAVSRLKEILNSLDFSYATINCEKPPKDEIYYSEIEIEDIKNYINNLENKIKSYVKYIDDIEILIDYLNLRREKYEIIAKLLKTKNTFILKGYLNPKYEKSLIDLVKQKFNSYIEIFEACSSSPVFLSNGPIVSPVEEITKTYSMPSINDIDPTPFMSFFYYMFFGMMFSDAGYGLTLSIFCLIFSISKNISYEKKKKLRMFLICGLATTFWGLLYGSFFGDIIEKIGKLFLNKNITLPPLWINATEKPLLLLLFSLNFGVIQILVGLIIKLVNIAKQKKLKEKANPINWIFVLFGIALLITGTIIRISWDAAKAIVFSIYFIDIGVISILFGVILTIVLSFYKNKGIMKFFGGFIELYGITSYVSDILSYSRLMALGIATGVIANVVNLLAAMGGKNFFGIIFFIIIALVGHSLNFAINILGAYVHTNRLQYVEFFSKFYEGGAKAFCPFSKHTKYIEFVETKNN